MAGAKDRTSSTRLLQADAQRESTVHKIGDGCGRLCLLVRPTLFAQGIVVISSHRYKIGQEVLLRTAARLGAPQGAYQIIQRLPARNNRLRYLIRSLEQEEYKLIVDESDLGRT
jgi:hypothetical protein